MRSASTGGILVTGASRGIGREIALGLGRAGWTVWCLSAGAEVEATALAINEAGGRAASWRVDLSEPPVHTNTTVEAMLRDAGTACAGAVLAAGILEDAGTLDTADLDVWARVMHVNWLGNLAALQPVWRRLQCQGSGRVVWLSGGGGAGPFPQFSAYAASKAAVVRTVENLHEQAQARSAGDLAVVALAPGAVETAMLAKVRAGGGAVRTVTDISEPATFTAAFLASPHADRLSGRLVHVRDGWRSVLQNQGELPEALWRLRRLELTMIPKAP